MSGRHCLPFVRYLEAPRTAVHSLVSLARPGASARGAIGCPEGTARCSQFLLHDGRRKQARASPAASSPPPGPGSVLAHNPGPSRAPPPSRQPRLGTHTRSAGRGRAGRPPPHGPAAPHAHLRAVEASGTRVLLAPPARPASRAGRYHLAGGADVSRLSHRCPLPWEPRLLRRSSFVFFPPRGSRHYFKRGGGELSLGGVPRSPLRSPAAMLHSRSFQGIKAALGPSASAGGGGGGGVGGGGGDGGRGGGRGNGEPSRSQPSTSGSNGGGGGGGGGAGGGRPPSSPRAVLASLRSSAVRGPRGEKGGKHRQASKLTPSFFLCHSFLRPIEPSAFRPPPLYATLSPPLAFLPISVDGRDIQGSCGASSPLYFAPS